jgi:hypothetical protein
LNATAATESLFLLLLKAENIFVESFLRLFTLGIIKSDKYVISERRYLIANYREYSTGINAGYTVIGCRLE